MNPNLQRRLPLLATAGIFLLLFGAAGAGLENFFQPRTFLNLFTDQAMVGIAAVGMTLVIFSGGIDLSVGALVGFTAIFVANQINNHGAHPLVAGTEALALGALFGLAQGAVIQIFRQPAFLVTLAGMFIARSEALRISQESMNIGHPFFRKLTLAGVPVGGGLDVGVPTLALLATVLGGWIVAHHTRFGRNLLAIGGSEQSAVLMGLPVGAVKIAVYAVSGACAALAGIVNAIVSSSGNATAGGGLELEAIAAVVIGGTVLTGGRGHMLGTLFGVLIIGTIYSACRFYGKLDSSWNLVFVGLMLLAFVLLQRLLLRGTRHA